MTAPKPSERRGRFTGFLVLVAAVYLGIGVSLTVMQRRLLYWPAKMSLATGRSIAADAGLSPWLNASGQIIGWKLPAGGQGTGSVLIVHGTDGCALDRTILSLVIRRAMSLNVYILEYPGYGVRGGSPGERSFLAAADEAWENHPRNLPTYVVSESLGAGVAAHLAQKYPAEVSGLVMFVPYDRLAAVAQSHLPLFPVRLLLWDQFDPAGWLQNYRGPVKCVIGGADWVIPPRFGRRLYDGYRGPKSLQVIPGAGHAETMKQSFDWWHDVLEFWRAHPWPPPSGGRTQP